jgi:hypothetical protein
MTNEQINIAIAEACGLDVIQNPHGSKDRPEAWKTGFFTPKAAKQRRISWPSSAIVKVIPNYCNDLNAMHEAEKGLPEKHKRTFAFILAQVLDTSPTVDLDDQFLNIHATAIQRAEAFLKTIGKWKEEK